MFAKLEQKIEARADVEKFPMASSICVFYPATSAPYMSINEVEASVVEGEVIGTEHIRTITKAYDPEGVVELMNPLTGEAVGKSMTETEIAMILYSVWISERKRVAAEEAEELRLKEEAEAARIVAAEEARIAAEEAEAARLAAEETEEV